MGYRKSDKVMLGRTSERGPAKVGLHALDSGMAIACQTCGSISRIGDALPMNVEAQIERWDIWRIPASRGTYGEGNEMCGSA